MESKLKETKRKAFNFLRSYYDIYNQLEKDSDKLSFLDAILNKQFLNEDPKDLEFIPKLCYEGQRHAIESSIKGWIKASKTSVTDTPRTDPPTDPPTPLGTNPPTDPKEEEEEEEEEEEVKPKKSNKKKKNIPTLSVFLDYIKEVKPDKYLAIQNAAGLKYQSWKANDWKDGNDKKISNWKTKILNTIPYLKEEQVQKRGAFGIL